MDGYYNVEAANRRVRNAPPAACERDLPIRQLLDLAGGDRRKCAIFNRDFRIDVGGDDRNDIEILYVRIMNDTYANFHVVPRMGSLNSFSRRFSEGRNSA